MKKWFFSNNGKVTAPLNLDEAKDYLAENPEVYGWHPSFTQWKPVCCISEFASILPPTEQSPLIPKEISDKFLAKQQRLEAKLTSIDDSINNSQTSLDKFDNQIEAYKDLTKNLNDDVKGAIDNIERKYNSIRRKLAQVKEAVSIAEKEMSVVVDEFDTRMSTNDIFMPSCNQSAVTQSNVNQERSDRAQASKAKLAQEKLATPHKRVEVVADNTAVNNNESMKKTAGPSLQEETATKESFGMKSMMKSVFKGDSKVDKVEEVKKGKEEPLSMAERLKMAQNNH
ncbi:DUF4339 domain-containing protein [Colwellia echini]|uniref:DUF4339 domain-containing protein n=1 Tax=Colwellia echini TaxID=1982103 RepID=A0ABY3MZW5_9GAMM|nr:DUF4339 domain-containing protein [Colwellia echini]TYK66780.1 DUF4339 domain-containing protein [Colwellia echini]